MATTSSGSAPREPRSIPDRVAIETLQGNIRAGDVVDHELRVGEEGPKWWLLVDIEGSGIWTELDDSAQVRP